MRDLPSGTVTFLFTDVEGSTRLLHELGAEAYAEALAAHRRELRAAFTAHGGTEVDTQGDAFFIAFPTAPGALQAAADGRTALQGGPISVRVGLHTGTPLLTDEGYVGEDVHRAARIAACGHGGQVLVSTSTAALVDSDQLHDLGEHRLKDLSAPERIYQLGDHEFPALKSLYRTNLPIPATPFLGREKELAEVLALLTRDDVRLLTLTGPGGTGKTRLALQAAAEASDAYPDGVFWVPLAPLRDPALVPEEASRAVGATDGLADHIADKHLLLLLDNFEHLLDAAAGLAGPLAACPNLRLIVTSREPLHLSGEQEYPVPPLAHDEGVQLFSSRARAIKPDFVPDNAVASICRRLDDLPLALELAAARIKALSPTQILERLEQRLPLLTGGARDLPKRQRTLRATIEWSHELLTPDEQRLFARLAVFRGGCTLDAAENICDADLDTLQSLVDKSLLRHNDGRYWMLETIREYAAEQLEESSEATERRQRHADRYLQLAETARHHLRRAQHRGPDDTSRQWLATLRAEHGNLRAALEQLQDIGETQSALHLAGALYGFWWEAKHIVEGSRYLEASLAADTRATAARAEALLAAADFQAVRSVVGDEEIAPEASLLAYVGEALAIYDALGDRAGRARALWIRADLLSVSDPPTAVKVMQEAVSILATLDDPFAHLEAIRYVYWLQGLAGEDVGRRRSGLEDLVARARETDAPRIEAITLGMLALIAINENRNDDALSLVHEHLRRSDALDPLRLTAGLFRAGFILARTGHFAAATRLLAASQRLSEEIGARQPWLVDDAASTAARLRVEVGDTAFETEWEEGRQLSFDAAVALALEETRPYG